MRNGFYVSIKYLSILSQNYVYLKLCQLKSQNQKILSVMKLIIHQAMAFTIDVSPTQKGPAVHYEYQSICKCKFTILFYKNALIMTTHFASEQNKISIQYFNEQIQKQFLIIQVENQSLLIIIDKTITLTKTNLSM